MFTAFYALPYKQASDSSIYEILTSPFIHRNKSVRLAQVPVYIGINRKAKPSISWTKDDTSSCIFQLMTTSRETTAEQATQYGNTCLEQIMTEITLTNCRTEQIATKRTMADINKQYVPSLHQNANGRKTYRRSSGVER